jgi:hypothetical protein
MKWYYLLFNEREIFEGISDKFIKDFISLIHKHDNPIHLGLYELKFKIPEGQVYYLSTPVKLDSEVKKILGPYNVQFMNRPNMNVLKLVYGK